MEAEKTSQYFCLIYSLKQGFFQNTDYSLTKNLIFDTMRSTDMSNKKVHLGKNIKRFREMLGVKQEVMAIDLGDQWNQQKVSLLEQKEEIDKNSIEQIAHVLKIPVEAIENFIEEDAVSYINTFNDLSTNHGAIGNNYDCTLNFNPLDKMIELYERMLNQQREMIEKLEKVINKS